MAASGAHCFQVAATRPCISSSCRMFSAGGISFGADLKAASWTKLARRSYLSASWTKITKVYPLDAVYDTPEDVPEDVKANKRYAGSSKWTVKVAIFMTLAMTLQRKPDVLVSLLPVLKESPEYFEQNMLPLNVCLITQAF